MAGIYVHIPFCRSKCFYCNFFSVASHKMIQKTANAIVKEISLQKNYLNEKIETIYFGGGTPSLLNVEYIENILNAINYNFKVNSDVEITIEANPDDINEEKIKSWRKLGINRLSIGVQSFDKDILNYLGRLHTVQAAVNAIETARKFGFNNISIDLIYGIPILSIEKWKLSLKTAISFEVEHISAYSLTVEKKTLLYKLIKSEKYDAIDDKLSIEHFKKTIELLEKAGYIHYEISNYCKPNFISKHNSAYWNNKNYLGIGPAAHSYNSCSRQWNIALVNSYIESIEQNIIPAEIETLSRSQKYNEYIMTRLRTMWGCNKNEIKNLFGNNYYIYFSETMKKYINNGYLRIDEESFILNKTGMLFADTVAEDSFYIE